MWLSAVSPPAFLRLTSLFSTVQMDPPPSWLLPFLFFILFSDYYQMPAACPAFLSFVCCNHSSCLPRDPSVPLRQALDAALHLCV